MTCIMAIFYFMSVITIISGFSCQIPASGKPLKLVYVLSLLSNYTFLFQKSLQVHNTACAAMRVDGILGAIVKLNARKNS